MPKLKRMLFAACERSIFLTWLMNLAAFNLSAVRYFRSRYQDGRRNYAVQGGLLGSNPQMADHNDPGLNFYVRLVLEYDYDFIIELGALTLDRCWAMASLFPQKRIYGLDITTDFSEPRIINRVNVGPNNLEYIRKIASQGGRGLVCAHGTLCCYSTKDLSDMIGTVRELKLDLAFSEPNTVGELSLAHSLKRTRMSFYHPYVKLLRDAGFELPDNNGHQIRDCWSEYAETRTFLFARLLQISS